jgi:hypothetical protein
LLKRAKNFKEAPGQPKNRIIELYLFCGSAEQFDITVDQKLLFCLRIAPQPICNLKLMQNQKSNRLQSPQEDDE